MYILIKKNIVNLFLFLMILIVSFQPYYVTVKIINNISEKAIRWEGFSINLFAMLIVFASMVEIVFIKNIRRTVVNIINNFEKKLINNYKTKYIILFLVIAALCSFLFVNSKTYIKININKIFNYRLSGDCESFERNLIEDVENWHKACTKEKDPYHSIGIFKIQNVSHNFFDEIAFVQIKLDKRTVNYELKKVGFKWKISTSYEYDN